ncbi:MAG: amidohydrolase family protein [Firmicutes bacterium]|nr:amidohydrolase family protein [Bacillota bacterium]
MLAFEGEIWVRSDLIIPWGILLVDQGKIVAVGEDVKVPSGVKVRKFTNGEKILPGFVEPHCHLGLYEEITGNENLNIKDKLISEEFIAWEQINFNNIGLFESALTGGVTTAGILPGSANLVGGIGSVVKTVGSNEILVNKSCLKVALGENVTKAHNLDRESLKKVLIGYFTDNIDRVRCMAVRVHCHCSDDIRLALEIKNMFDLNMILEHLTEGHVILEEISKSGVKAVTGPFFVGRPKLEMANLDRGLTTKLVDSGVETSFMTDYPSNPPEMLKIALLEVIKNGVQKMRAFDMITLGSARMLGVADRVGSLEVGKDGDIVIHSHSPFLYKDRILEVYEKGVRITWPNIF